MFSKDKQIIITDRLKVGDSSLRPEQQMPIEVPHCITNHCIGSKAKNLIAYVLT